MSPRDTLAAIVSRLEANRRNGVISDRRWEEGGDELRDRTTVRGMVQLARSTCEERSLEAAMMLLDDYLVDFPVYPFEHAPDDHPFKATAHLIGYMATVDRSSGMPVLLRLQPDPNRGKKDRPATDLGDGARWLELDAPLPSFTIPALAPPVAGEQENPKPEGYQINARMSMEQVVGFLGELQCGLLTFLEKAIAAEHMKHFRHFKPPLYGAIEELVFWDNQHPKEKPEKGARTVK